MPPHSPASRRALVFERDRDPKADFHSLLNWGTTQRAMEILVIPLAQRSIPTSTQHYIRKQSGQWFNPNAFIAPVPGTFGNAGRDTLTGPGLKDADLSLIKDVSLRERLRAQFRAEFFNVLNHSNFTTPNAVVYSTGPTPAKPLTEAALSPTAGVVTATATTSRQIQFALKVLF